MNIDRHDLNTDVLIIAEIGNNHEGDLDLAIRLIELASDAGADAVKFQTIVPERLVAPSETARLEQLRRFALSPDDFQRLAVVAHDAGVLFLSTPFDADSVDCLEPLVPAYKIASGDNNFHALIERVCATGKPVLMSTGFMTFDEIRAARDRIRASWTSRGIDPGLALLHCVSAYPTPPADANLRVITALRTLGVTAGYSDHTQGTDAAPLAVALGARIIEKHFTIAHDHSPFRDHQLSADPAEMRTLVQRVRDAETLLGATERTVGAGERAIETAARRSVVAARPLGSGHIIEMKDLDWVRPAIGLSCGEEWRVLGRALARSVGPGEPIRPDDCAKEA